MRTMALRLTAVHQMLDQHRLVARGGPQERQAEPGLLLERRHQLPRRHLDHRDVGDRGEAVVGGTQQDAAQADDVARDREVDHLPPTVRQQLVGTGPAILEDEGVVADLPLVHQLGAGRDKAAMRLEPIEHGQLLPTQREVTGQLADQRAVEGGHVVETLEQNALRGQRLGFSPVQRFTISRLLWISPPARDVC